MEDGISILKETFDIGCVLYNQILISSTSVVVKFRAIFINIQARYVVRGKTDNV